MFTWWTVLRWLHITGAILWLGGLTFVVLILRPTLKGLPDQATSRSVLARTSARMRVMINIVIPLQIATGTIMAWRLLNSWSALVTSGWGRILLVKVSLATVMFLLYYIVPRLLLADGPKTVPGAPPEDCPTHMPGPPSAKQKLGSLLHVVLMTLGFVVVLLAKMLV